MTGQDDRRRRERRAQRWSWSSVLAVTALAALANGQDAGQAATQVTAVFVLSAAWIPLLSAAFHRVLDPFNPSNLFLLSFGLEFGLYPLFVLNGGARLPLFSLAAGSGIESHYFAAELLAALGLLSYRLGYGSGLARRMERSLPRPRPLDPQRVKALCKVLFVAGYLGAICIFWKEGGLAQFLANREQWRAGGLSGSGIFLMAAWLWLPAAALLPMMQFTRPPGDRHDCMRRLAARLVFLGICLIPVYLLGFRTLIVTPVLECVAILHYLRTRVSVTRTLAVGLMLAGLMTIYGLSRNDVALDLDLMQSAGPQATLDYLLFRTPGTDTVATVLSNPRSAQFEYGISGAIEAATILIPRALWPGKPLSWGEQYTTRYFADYLFMTGNIRDSYGGVNPTVIGYLYLQLGGWGVVAGMFLIGAASRMIYLYGLRHAGPNTAFLLFILVWPLPIMVAEGPQNALNQLVITLLCAWWPLSYWAAPRNRSPLHKPEDPKPA
jgi:hypothetical protein